MLFNRKYIHKNLNINRLCINLVLKQTWQNDMETQSLRTMTLSKGFAYQLYKGYHTLWFIQNPVKHRRLGRFAKIAKD